MIIHVEIGYELYTFMIIFMTNILKELCYLLRDHFLCRTIKFYFMLSLAGITSEYFGIHYFNHAYRHVYLNI